MKLRFLRSINRGGRRKENIVQIVVNFIMGSTGSSSAINKENYNSPWTISWEGVPRIIGIEEVNVAQRLVYLNWVLLQMRVDCCWQRMGMGRNLRLQRKTLLWVWWSRLLIGGSDSSHGLDIRDERPSLPISFEDDLGTGVLQLQLFCHLDNGPALVDH